MPQNNISGMPPEYAQQLADILRRRQMAQGLYNAQLQNRPTEMGGGGKYNYAVRQSPLEAIARLATGYVANKADQAGSDEQAKLLTKNSEEESLSLQTLAGVGPQQKELLAQYLASNRPSIRAAAEARRKYFEERGDKLTDSVITTARDYGDPQAAVDIATGKRAPEAWQWGGMKEPEFKSDPEGNAYVLTRNVKGEPRVGFAPKKNEVNVTVGDKEEGKAITDLNAKDLEGLMGQARTAQKTIANVARIAGEFEKGAQSGFGQSWILTAQKLGNLLGANFDTTAPTETVKTALQEGVLGKAQALRPVSNDEVKFLQQMVGSIDTDPEALTNLLAWYNAQSLWEIQNFQKQRDAMAAANPRLKDRYATVGAGIELPKDLQGQPWFKFKSYEMLQMIGGDEALAPFGFEPGSKFRLGRLHGGLPGAKSNPQQTKSTEELIRELTSGGKKK